MKLVHAERNGEAFDSQLVIGVRESYVNLCSSAEDKHKEFIKRTKPKKKAFLGGGVTLGGIGLNQLQM